MSKKRISPESRTDEPTNNDTDQDDSVKRAKLILFSDTTLQDLPVELVECILVRAIVMEVEEMHLAKSVWKEKGDLVISRLSSVCPDWSNILTTNFFQNELYRTLDRTVDSTIRLEILHQYQLRHCVFEAIIFLDELVVLSVEKDDYVINVYDRNNLAELKDNIPLPGIEPKGLAACSVSNCLYILNIKKFDDVFVLRITKEQDHKFSISPWISRRWKPNAICVSDNGSLILWKRTNSKQSTKIEVYDENGTLQHTTKLTSDLYRIDKLIPMPAGNLVLVSTKDEHNCRTKLTEIDMNGTVLRQYQSPLKAFDAVCLVEPHARLMIIQQFYQIELLDREFNLLNIIGLQLHMDEYCYFSRVSYDSHSMELVTLTHVDNLLLSFFRLAED